MNTEKRIKGFASGEVLVFGNGLDSGLDDLSMRLLSLVVTPIEVN